ncbi:hypothetical protein [Pararhodonellum marinum]|uniref:hypothetical protein n=1 Tax=Pararhodonellum marinum TaxID=2755358 RepID=UPI00188F6C71|nr:hypothetical protein [Pararhodonellum marinum]
MKSIAIAFLVLLLPYVTMAQDFKWDANVHNFQRLAYQGNAGWGWNGAALSGSYFFEHRSKTKIETGLEYGFNGISHYVFAKGAYHYVNTISDSRWWYSAGGQIFQGMALFRPSPLYMGGLGVEASINYQLRPKLALGLSMGLRHYGSPAYGKYSQVNRFWDLPIGLHFRF